MKMKTSYTELLIKDSDWLSVEEKEIILFGLKQGKSLLYSVLATLLTGLLMGLLWESILFVICFLPLRRFAGGFHAKTRGRCLIFSMMVVITAFLFIKYIRCTDWMIAGISFLCLVVLWIIAPVGNEKRLLSEEETACFGKKTKIIMGIETFIMLAILFSGENRYAVVVMSVFVTESLCAILGYIKLKGFERKERLRDEKT